MQEKSKIKPTLSPEVTEHYTEIAEKLVFHLTFEEQVALRSKPLGPCPLSASSYCQTVHSALKNANKESATGAEVVWADFLVTALSKSINVYQKDIAISGNSSNSSEKPRSFFLPDDIINLIEFKLRAVSYQASFASTCWSFYKLYKRALPKQYNIRIQAKNEKIKELCTYVIQGNQAEAEKLIQEDPGLLLEKWGVKDYSGRTVKGTPLQIALGAEDVKYQDDEECMAEMIMRYLVTLPEGEKKRDAQILEQFPAGWENKEAQRAKNDLKELHKVVEGIGESKTEKEAEPFIQAFVAYLAKQKKGVIKTGKHFNIQILAEAFTLYEKKFNDFEGYNTWKNNLFWRRVIGHIQRYLPACYAQAFCQGVYYIVDNKEPLSRGLEFKNGSPGVFYYPLDSNPFFILGVNYAGAVYGLCAPLSADGVGGVALLADYVKQKHQHLENLCCFPAIHRGISAS